MKEFNELTKLCWHCKQTKPISQFYLNKSKKDYLDDRCKICKEIFRQKQIENNLLYPPTKTEKLCRGCNKILNAEFFSKSRCSPTGLQSKCKNCNKIYMELKKGEKNDSREII